MKGDEAAGNFRSKDEICETNRIMFPLPPSLGGRATLFYQTSDDDDDDDDDEDDDDDDGDDGGHNT